MVSQGYTPRAGPKKTDRPGGIQSGPIGGSRRVTGIDRLGAAMAVAFVFLMPIGFLPAARVFDRPGLVLAGIGVGVCSPVIPYFCDQIAMSRLPRASFALPPSLLPAAATVIAAIVLTQIPTVRDLAGVALVMAGIAVHIPPRVP